MTSSNRNLNRRRMSAVARGLFGALLSMLAALPAMAALGETDAGIGHDTERLAAVHQVRPQGNYVVHELQQADGSRIHQYVTSDHRVFAVAWHAQHKPDLSVLLGSSYASSVRGVQAVASQPGVQRHFQHLALDLVVQNSGYLNVFKGYAYRPSLVPPGFSLSANGLE